jgi:exopolyphosphatase/guanosine-5'-triphosphate,3'-diphosphate pyrophosphatase
MSRRDKLLLEVAGILHDVGTFIAARDHQRHSQYIVSHSEIFGLHQEDIDIVSNVIGSHRGPPPQETDITYIALQREDRMRVLKMVSMLRVADALDRRHSQHIQTIEVERRRDTLMIRVPQDCGTEIERLSLADKSDMFLDIFGFKVVIG